jgi:response regulator RpfG family c-di-GMP phosphodiesterase
MPLEKAYSIIREESGTHFDERVVDAFFAVTDKIETVLEN